MPRESVYQADPVPGTDDEQAIAEVSWHRDGGFVQIVTRLESAEVPSVAERVPEIPARYGYYVNLDRSGINKLIRNLRRARDQAFGRDE